MITQFEYEGLSFPNFHLEGESLDVSIISESVLGVIKRLALMPEFNLLSIGCVLRSVAWDKSRKRSGKSAHIYGNAIDIGHGRTEAGRAQLERLKDQLLGCQVLSYEWGYHFGWPIDDDDDTAASEDLSKDIKGEFALATGAAIGASFRKYWWAWIAGVYIVWRLLFRRKRR